MGKARRLFVVARQLSKGVHLQVDLISFNGPTFEDWDNRVAALRLVQKELCDAALFDPSGDLPCPPWSLHCHLALPDSI